MAFSFRTRKRRMQFSFLDAQKVVNVTDRHNTCFEAKFRSALALHW